MYREIKYHLVQTLIIWIVWYSVWVFSIWEFFNPFRWIIDMPTYSSGDRFIGLFFWLFYMILSVLSWKEYFKEELPE